MLDLVERLPKEVQYKICFQPSFMKGAVKLEYDLFDFASIRNEHEELASDNQPDVVTPTAVLENKTVAHYISLFNRHCLFTYYTPNLQNN